MKAAAGWYSYAHRLQSDRDSATSTPLPNDQKAAEDGLLVNVTQLVNVTLRSAGG